jgi:hypothetical protein
MTATIPALQAAGADDLPEVERLFGAASSAPTGPLAIVDVVPGSLRTPRTVDWPGASSTTSRAGGLFRCRPGVRGLLPVPFAG